MKTFWIGIGALGLAVTGGFIALPAEREVHPAVRREGLDAQDTHASTSLLGQLRASSSSWLYARADLYLHNGVEMRPLTETEVKNGRKGVGVGDEGSLHNEDLSVTVVPDSIHDFRGIFGDIEREGSAYKDMTKHPHQNPVYSLPLFRIMTWMDPQFIAGWTVGAQIMSGEKTKATTAKSLEFLGDGLNQNPDSIEILTQIGLTYIVNRKDFASAIDNFGRARKIANRGQKLSAQELDALDQAYRWLALAYKETSTDFDRIYAAREGLDRFPDDPVLKRLAH